MVTQLFEKIKTLISNNELDEALEIAEQAIQAYPGEAEAYFLSGEIYSEKQMKDKAVEYYEKACFFCPDTVKYLGRLAEHLLLVGKTDESIAHYRSVLKIDSTAAWAYIGLGNAFERKGENSRCIKYFKQALKRSEPSIDLLSRLIKLQKLQGDLEGVIESLEKLMPIISDEDDKYDALCHLARSFYLLDKHKPAIENYLLAIGIFDDKPIAYVGLADAYHKLDQIEDEIEVLKKVNLIEENFELSQRLLELLQNTNDSLVDVAKSKSFSELDKKKLIVSNYSERDLSAIVNVINESGLFNYIYYKQQTGLVLSITDAIEHFLRIGSAQGCKPLLSFCPSVYLSLNPDLPTLTNAQCFVHYVLKGKAEKRYFDRDKLTRDASDLRLSPDFDDVWYSSLIKNMPEGLNCYEHYLTIGWRQGLPPKREGFDSGFYLACYKDAFETDIPPYLHYLKNKRGRITSQTEANQWVHFIHQSDEFDSALYRIQYKEPISDKLSDILHYICHGVELKLDPNSNFSTEYYIRKYPDILSNGIFPFIHYLANGRAEGRINKFEAKNHIRTGKRAFNPNKPTILIVCHEASRTGAPILGLRLVDQLSQRANIVVWLGKQGPIEEDFSNSSVAIINTSFDHADTVWMVRELQKRFLIKGAIVNSVATVSIASALYEEQIPMVALIHEYSDYMGAQVVQMQYVANRVVFPSQGVRASADRVSLKSFGMPCTHIAVRHQGRCIPPVSEHGVAYKTKDILLKLGVSEDSEMPAIVLGCGWVQMRKGVEYFIEAAKLCKELLDRPVRFIWVGGGYAPEIDLNYSVWLQSQVVHSDLEDEVVFFDETIDLTPFFDLADVFFMSSRLDPFPNVAIDAVDAGVPIVAFEQATGFSEFINQNPSVGVAVPFLDVRAAAEAMCDYITGKRVCVEENDAVKALFSFASYAEFVWNECQQAIAQQQAIIEESELLTKSKVMDIEFFKSSQPNWQSKFTPEYVYVSMWARGILTAKSRIGFNDKVAQASLASTVEEATITPLAQVANAKILPLTHNIIYVNPDEPIELPKTALKVAVHIHTFYTENLPLLLSRLSGLVPNAWLCITTDTDKKAKIIKSVADNAHVFVIPNRGRDVGPFMMMMQEHLSQFDVVGHFHLKGTKQLEQTVVRQWQDFLYDSLIGKQGEVANTLLGMFEQQPKLGLLFQEDPCLPSWSKNFDLAKSLLEDLEIDRALPENIEYPTGNMFWVRTAALAPLMARSWEWSDFPSEPVPYDGSILHAIERLTPIICQEAGYEWATVHNAVAKRYS